MNVKKTGRFLLLAAGTLGATAAMARGYYDAGYGGDRMYGVPDAYVGLNVGALQYQEDGLDTFTPAAALLRLGVPLSRNLAFEARAGAGLGSTSNGGYDVSMRSFYAGYVKGSVPLAPTFALYAVGGVAGVNMKRNFGVGSTTDTGLSFGVGADFNLGGGAGLNVEWTRLPDGNNGGYDYSNSMATIGMTWRF